MFLAFVLDKPCADKELTFRGTTFDSWLRLFRPYPAAQRVPVKGVNGRL